MLSSGYRPELDVSPYCDNDSGIFYQQQVGILWWIVEFGCIDIGTEVSMMASYSMAPREGHLQVVLHMFMYLSTHQRSTLVLDPSYISHSAEPSCDWRGFYPDAKEEYPANVPEPLGRSVQITAFVDLDHAGDLISRRSRTGVLIYINQAPIIWHSKCQNSVETSTFGSEFMALKTGIELIKGLHHKL